MLTPPVLGAFGGLACWPPRSDPAGRSSGGRYHHSVRGESPGGCGQTSAPIVSTATSASGPASPRLGTRPRSRSPPLSLALPLNQAREDEQGPGGPRGAEEEGGAGGSEGKGRIFPSAAFLFFWPGGKVSAAGGSVSFCWKMMNT